MTYELNKERNCNLFVIVPSELRTIGGTILCIDNSQIKKNELLVPSF